MRITKDILKNKVEYLNSIANKKYDVDYAYGDARLVLVSEYGGVTEISPRGTKTEIGTIIDAIIKFHKIEKAQ